MRKQKASVLVVLLFLLTLFLGTHIASAASANVSRSYNASTDIPYGSLVCLLPGDTNSVESANQSNAVRLIGVVVHSNESLLAVNPQSGNVQVATNGSVNALVSDVNGNISVGQNVAVSPFNGVGMKADPGDRVVGIATTSFNPNTAGASNEQVADSFGKSRKITVGYVKLTIGVGTLSSSNFSIQSVQLFTEGLTGHPITVLRLIIAMIVSVVAIVSIVTLIYASIYGSIVSIGRNPLAKLAVFRTLTSVIGMVTLIAAVAAITVYFLLY